MSSSNFQSVIKKVNHCFTTMKSILKEVKFSELKAFLRENVARFTESLNSKKLESAIHR